MVAAHADVHLDRLGLSVVPTIDDETFALRILHQANSLVFSGGLAALP
jgi:hypothetical protein